MAKQTFLEASGGCPHPKPERRLDIHSLAVAVYDAEYATPEVKSWVRDKKLPAAELCTHHIVYGFREDFASFPGANDLRSEENPDGAFHVMHGAEAYAYLLDLVCGLESKRTAETHVRRQFFKRWDKYAQKNPICELERKAFMAQIRHDSGLTLRHVLTGFSSSRYENAARDLSKQEKDDRVLIVCDVNKSGYISTLATSMIQISNARDATRNNPITLTHPDPAQLPNLAASVAYLESCKRIRPGVQVAPFSDFAALVEKNNKVYVVARMGEDPEADGIVMDCWRGRADRSGILTHLNGTVQESIEAWRDAALDNYLSPEDILAESARRESSNETVLEQARAFHRQCARTRLEGDVPGASNLDVEQLEDVSLED